MSALLFARKDLERLRRAPTSLALWIGIPLVIGGMLALATGGGSGGSRLQAHLLVADADHSFGSDLLVTSLQKSGMVRTEAVEADVGRARIADGDGSALLIVPAGFADDVLRDRPTRLELITNPAQRILPGIVEAMLRSGASAVCYAQALLGPEGRRLADTFAKSNEPANQTAFALAITASGAALVEQLRPYFEPLRIEFVDRVLPSAVGAATASDDAATGGNFGTKAWPGMLLMALFFAGQGLGEDLWDERRLGTLRRVVASPAGVRPWLLGKLLCAAAVAAIVGIVGLGGGVLMLGLPLRAMLLGVPWMAVIGAAILLLLWPLVCVASSARAANVLTSAVMFPLLMLGGSFFPFEWMPAWMARVGSATPNGWLLLRLRALVDGRFEPWHLLGGLVAMAVLAVVVVPFCERRLVRAVAG